MMRSPGSSVTASEMSEMSRNGSRSMSRTRPNCTRSPLT